MYTLSIFNKTDQPRLYINGTTRSKLYAVQGETGCVKLRSAAMDEAARLPYTKQKKTLQARKQKDLDALTEFADAIELDREDPAEWDRLWKLAEAGVEFGGDDE